MSIEPVLQETVKCALYLVALYDIQTMRTKYRYPPDGVPTAATFIFKVRALELCAIRTWENKASSDNVEGLSSSISKREIRRKRSIFRPFDVD